MLNSVSWNYKHCKIIDFMYNVFTNYKINPPELVSFEITKRSPNNESDVNTNVSTR